MHILLINAPYFGGFKKLTLELPPLGLAYIAGVLKKAGHKVGVLDLAVTPEYSARLDDFDLVAISADTPRHNQAMALARKVKKQRVAVAMGGPHVSFLAEETLKSGFVDYVIRGEGEYSMLSLVDHLAQGEDLENVPGLSYQTGEQIIHNRDQAMIRNVDELPYPARELLPMEKYGTKLNKLQATSVIGSRGCPFNCSFCASSELFGLRWRAREPEAIVDELADIKKRYGIKAIYFMDDNFTLKPDRTIEICELIKKRGLDIRWWCFSRVNTIVEREDMVQSMAESGCNMVFLGVESPNSEVLEHYHKKISADLSFKAIEKLKYYHIKPMASFIIGEIDETRDMIKNTIKFARKLKPEVAQFTILTPYPGTELFEKVKNRIINTNWDLFDGLHSTIRTKYVSPTELEKLLKKAYFSFYLRSNKFFSHPVYWFWLSKQIPQIFKDYQQCQSPLSASA